VIALREWLRRPIGEQRWLLAALVFVVGFGALVLVSPRLVDDDPARPTPTEIGSAPSPVIEATEPQSDSAEGADARPTARRFVNSYLAFIYGRAEAEDIAGVTAAVRRELAASRPRVPPALRQRRPRVIDLRLTQQTRDAVLATASVDDGDVAVYPIVFTLDRRRSGVWVVSRLAND